MGNGKMWRVSGSGVAGAKALSWRPQPSWIRDGSFNWRRMVEHTGSQLDSVSRRFYADLHSLCVQCCGPRNSAVGDSWLSFSGLCLHSCGTATSYPRLLACEEEAIAASALAALVEE